MAFHFSICDDFKKRTNNFINQDRAFNQANLYERIALISVIIHSVDIGSAVLGFEGFFEWGARVVQEFHD